MTIYYIDPSAGTNGNGSEANPFNSWGAFTITSNNTYLQKAGTTTLTFPNIATGQVNVTIGRYGSGDRPKIYYQGSYIQIQGNDFKMADFEITSLGSGILVLCTGFIFDNIYIHHNQVQYGFAFSTGSSGILKNSTIEYTARSNIEVRSGCITAIIENCTLRYPQQIEVVGDNIGGANNGVYNLIVRNCYLYKEDNTKQNIMSATTGSIEVTDTTMINNGTSGAFTTQGCSSLIFKRNKCYSLGTGGDNVVPSNGAARGCLFITANGTDITGTCYIENNLFVINNTTNFSSYYPVTLQSATATSVFYIRNNTFVSPSTTQSLVYFNTSVGNFHFVNNIFSGGLYQIYHQGTATINTATNNIYTIGAKWVYNGFIYNNLAAWQTITSKDSNSIQADPLLNSDYSVSSNSPAIGTGLLWWTNARPSDIVGAPLPDFGIDIGAVQSKSHPFHPVNIKG